MSDFIPSVLMGNEILSASLSSETLESFWFTWVKSFIERKINNIDEGVWNRIKPEFKKISEKKKLKIQIKSTNKGLIK